MASGLIMTLKCNFSIFFILNLFESFPSQNKNHLFATMKALFDGSEKSSCTTKNNVECIFLTFFIIFFTPKSPQKIGQWVSKLLKK